MITLKALGLLVEMYFMDYSKPSGEVSKTTELTNPEEAEQAFAELLDYKMIDSEMPYDETYWFLTQRGVNYLKVHGIWQERK